MPSAAPPVAAATAGAQSAQPTAPAAASQRDAVPVALASASPAGAAQPASALELLTAIEPELDDRMLRRMRRDGVVTLAFTVNPDGSVSDAMVQASTDAALEAISLDAVRQWRYKPIPQARTHRVQFVFKHE